MKGKERGYVTTDEIAQLFDKLNQRPPRNLQPAFTLLRSMGIQVPESDTDRPPSQG